MNSHISSRDLLFKKKLRTDSFCKKNNICIMNDVKISRSSLVGGKLQALVQIELS